MKKNTWENVYYRLNDETEIKLAILFCIQYAGFPLSDIELKHMMLTATSVDFMDLCSGIEAVILDGYMKKAWRDEIEKFTLTEQGQELLDMFEDKIMASVRASLKSTIDDYFKREEAKAQVKCEIVPMGKDKYNLDIELKEGKNTLVEMSVFVGSRDTAIRLRRGFNADPMGFYSGLISMLSKAEEKTEEK